MKLTIRNEQKQAVLEFLKTTQRVELLIDEWKVAPHTENYRDTPLSTDGGEAAAAVHAMWLEARRLELVCSADVNRAAIRYAEKATNTSGKTRPTRYATGTTSSNGDGRSSTPQDTTSDGINSPFDG
jgi:hypothetical protein